jgi:putative methyltransferase (TIGR04325 family)
LEKKINIITAPIVLFVFNRPDHTLRALNSLRENLLADQSLLYIISDGPRQGTNANDLEKINQVREIIKSEKWCAEVIIHENQSNRGLSGSIIPEVTRLLEKHEKLIVLEDDIYLSKGFLEYMNSALEMYNNDTQVGCVHGWNYHIDAKNYKESTFFLKGADCWGWATWKRAWNLFEKDGSKLLETIRSKKLEYDFDRRGTHNYTELLEHQVDGKLDSWAVRWHASLFLANMYCLHPTESIVKNIGLDNSGTNCFDTHLEQDPINFINLEKIAIEEADWFFETYKNFLHTTSIRFTQGSKINRLIKSALPESFTSIIKKIMGGNTEQWAGDYRSWQQAKKKCKGYDDAIILKKCETALLKIKNGEAIYERDSVLFDKIQYSRGLLNLLKKVSTENNGALSVLDFGGSLGSTYYQNKQFLDSLSNVEWCIVEQKHFVVSGKKHFEDDRLKFFFTIEECLANHKPDILILSSVLNYLEDPAQWIEKFTSLGLNYILIDSTPFLTNSEKDLLTVQTVPPEIYEASYPAWFFGKERLRQLQEKYDLVDEFKNGFNPSMLINKKQEATWLGLILKKRF